MSPIASLAAIGPPASWPLYLLFIGCSAPTGDHSDRMSALTGSPRRPVITEPSLEGKVLNAADVHMGTAPFSHPDPQAVHTCTDWEIWTVSPQERVWITACIGGVEKVHAHLGDGVFEGSHAGRRDLVPGREYQLRVRHRDNSMNPATEWSPYAMRGFSTAELRPPLPGVPVWPSMQPGYIVERFATGFQLPVNIAFVPNSRGRPSDPFFYVTELHGTIKVVTHDGAVRDYARNLLNFDPTGPFPGSGEQGLTGILVEPQTGDVIASMLYDAGGSRYPKVVRFHSNDGGMSAARQTTIIDMVGETQGQSHQISNLSLGPDGKLYVHVGDGFDVSKAQDLNSFRGKILRMSLDGSAPADNPFYNAADGISARDYVYAYGLRNPFGGAWRASNSSLYAVENGPGVDRFARIDRGANYGWNDTDVSMEINALYNWSPAVAPVNLVFVQLSTFHGSGFPEDKMDHAFVSESGPTFATGPTSVGKKISEFSFKPDGTISGPPRSLVVYNGSGKSSIAALAAGPDGLYFSTLYKEDAFLNPAERGAEVYRVRYVPGSVPGGPGTILFSQDFAGPLSGWTAHTSLPTDPGHSFAINAAGQLRSDPAGATRQRYTNRIDSPYFSLAGTTSARIRLDSRHQLSGTDSYQIYLYTPSGDTRSLIADFRGQNRAWPDFTALDLPVPPAFLGKAAVQISFVVSTGSSAPAFGVLLDNLQVVSGAGGCPLEPPRGTILFSQDFAGPLSGWTAHTSLPTDPGHSFAINAAGQLRSDPAGATRQRYTNRIDSPYFSLAGTTSARIRLDSRHQLSGTDSYQIYLYTPSGDTRSLIADFRGQNRAWPDFTALDLPVPPAFLGKAAVQISFVVSTGSSAPAFGVLLDNLQVVSGAGGCPLEPPRGTILFSQDFAGPLSGWTAHTSLPTDPGHSFAINAAGQLRSDPAGATRQRYTNRIDSPYFSLAGTTSARIRLDSRHQLSGTDSYQIYLYTPSGDTRSLIADFRGQNRAWPDFTALDLPVPPAFLGKAAVQISFVVSTGSSAPAFGVLLDNLQVVSAPHG